MYRRAPGSIRLAQFTVVGSFGVIATIMLGFKKNRLYLVYYCTYLTKILGSLYKSLIFNVIITILYSLTINTVPLSAEDS